MDTSYDFDLVERTSSPLIRKRTSVGDRLIEGRIIPFTESNNYEENEISSSISEEASEDDISSIIKSPRIDHDTHEAIKSIVPMRPILLGHAEDRNEKGKADLSSTSSSSPPSRTSFISLCPSIPGPISSDQLALMDPLEGWDNDKLLDIKERRQENQTDNMLSHTSINEDHGTSLNFLAQAFRRERKTDAFDIPQFTSDPLPVQARLSLLLGDYEKVKSHEDDNKKNIVNFTATQLALHHADESSLSSHQTHPLTLDNIDPHATILAGEIPFNTRQNEGRTRLEFHFDDPWVRAEAHLPLGESEDQMILNTNHQDQANHISGPQLRSWDAFLDTTKRQKRRKAEFSVQSLLTQYPPSSLRRITEMQISIFRVDTTTTPLPSTGFICPIVNLEASLLSEDDDRMIQKEFIIKEIADWMRDHGCAAINNHNDHHSDGYIYRLIELNEKGIAALAKKKRDSTRPKFAVANCRMESISSSSAEPSVTESFRVRVLGEMMAWLQALQDMEDHKVARSICWLFKFPNHPHLRQPEAHHTWPPQGRMVWKPELMLRVSLN